MMIYRTANEAPYTFGPAAGGYTVTIPAGIRCRPIDGEPGAFFVDEFGWCAGRHMVEHDARHYGIRVTSDNIDAMDENYGAPNVLYSPNVVIQPGPMSIEVTAVRFPEGHVETMAHPTRRAQGFAVYIRNPMALHVLDFTPDSINPGGKRVTLREALRAAMLYGETLAEHLGCNVARDLSKYLAAFPSRFVIEPQRDYNADDLADTGTAFGLAGDNDATQWAVLEKAVGADGLPIDGSADLVEDYPSREAAEAAIDALERGQPLPNPVWPPKRDVLPEGMTFYVAAISGDDGVHWSDVLWWDGIGDRAELLTMVDKYALPNADTEAVSFYGPFNVGGGAF